MIKIRLLFLGLLLYVVSFGQNSAIDSLKNVLLSQKEDTIKVNILNKLSKRLANANKYGDALFYATKALKLAEKLYFKNGIRVAYWGVVTNYYLLSKYDKYFEFSFKALKYFETVNNLEKVGFYLNNMSFIYEMMGDTTESLRYQFASLKVREKINDKWGIIQSTNSIGLFYSGQGKCLEALQMHKKAFKILTDVGEVNSYKNMLAFTYQSFAVALEKLGDQAENTGNKKIARAEYGKSLENLQLSYNIWQALDNEEGMAGLNYYMGNIFKKLKNYKSANFFLQKALKSSLKFGLNEDVGGMYLSLSQLDIGKGNYKGGYENYKKYISYRDSIGRKDLIRNVESHKGKSEIEKKETELKLLTTQNKLQTLIAKEQKQRKNFAYVTIALIIIAGSIGYFQLKSKRKTENSQQIMKERLRISQELHDEIGATLSGISMYSHLTKEQLKNGQANEVENSLNIMQQNSGEMVNKLNDIVWFINPNEDTLQKTMLRLDEYATNMGAIKHIKVSATLPTTLAEIVLPVESRRNIYLFCKEAINNAVKYSEATELSLIVEQTKTDISISIVDNGKGFELATVKKGNGLESIQKRAIEVGAIFNVQTEIGEGSTIGLTLKNKRG